MIRAALLLALAPLTAHAEGARTLFSCTGLQTCDATGACQPDNTATTFGLAPETTGTDGDGLYTLTHDNQPFEMKAMAMLGPFVWSEGPHDRQTLLITGERAALWHSLDLATGTSQIRFLTCEVTR